MIEVLTQGWPLAVVLIFGIAASCVIYLVNKFNRDNAEIERWKQMYGKEYSRRLEYEENQSSSLPKPNSPTIIETPAKYHD